MNYEQQIWEFDIAKFERMRVILERGCSQTMRDFAVKSMESIKGKYASLKNEEIPTT